MESSASKFCDIEHETMKKLYKKEWGTEMEGKEEIWSNP